jgi:hypothetical protein
VCLDKQGRPRSVTETLTSTAGNTAAKLTATLTFTQYGRPPQISAPKAARLQSRHIATPEPLFGGPTRIFERLLATTTP